MNYRRLGKTGFEVSEIGLGAWQLGGKWGSAFSHDSAERILHAAIDQGVNFIDTADVYSAGESEAAVGRVLKARSERIYVATKCGRQIRPHTNENYTPRALRTYVENSLRNMRVEALDLIQLHCPPWEVYYRPEIFGLFERLKEEGKILNMGVSVEKVEEALKAIEYPNVTTVQIIFNMFRHRPSELFFPEAQKKGVGILARVPLASGLLTGAYGKHTLFQPGDHRRDNRQGEQFDKGETFSGVDYDTGLKAVAELKKLFPGRESLAPVALRWVLMFDAVSTVIPGASRVEQVAPNLAAAALPPLTAEEMQGVRAIYGRYIRELVHQLW